MLRRRVLAAEARPDVDGVEQVSGAGRHHAVERGRAADRAHGAVASFLGHHRRGAPEEAGVGGEARGGGPGAGRVHEDTRLQAGADPGGARPGGLHPPHHRPIVLAAQEGPTAAAGERVVALSAPRRRQAVSSNVRRPSERHGKNRSRGSRNKSLD